MNNVEHFKRKARHLAKVAVERGKLHKMDKCELCGSDSKLFMHHDDYTKPLEVKWLCKNCHWGGVHNPKSLNYQPPEVLPAWRCKAASERINKTNFNHNYTLPKVVKDILKFNKTNFSAWCRKNNIKNSRARDIFSRRVTGRKGIYSEIWLLLDREFPGWSEEIFSR